MPDTICQKIEALDADILNEFGVSDRAMLELATEHGSRVGALCKIVNPTAGKTVLLGIAKYLLDVAKDVDRNSYQEPELVNAI